MSNALNRAKWVKALRSGDYTQGTGALGYMPNGVPAEVRYCCLGVACEVLGIFRGSSLGSTVLYYRDGGTDYASEPPERVADALGLTAEHINTLITMNDDQKLSFNEIADWIEENV